MVTDTAFKERMTALSNPKAKAATRMPGLPGGNFFWKSTGSQFDGKLG